MKVMLLFTFGTSAQNWAETGLLKRECLIYSMYEENGCPISFLTYGGDLDRAALSDYPFQVVPVYSAIKKSTSHLVNVLNSIRIPWTFRAKFREVDVIKTNQMYGAWIGGLAKLFFRKKLVVRCGYERYRNRCERAGVSLPVRWFEYLSSFAAYRFADTILISSESDADYAAVKFRSPREKFTIHRNFIDTDHFKPSAETAKESNRVLFVGRVIRRKGLADLIRSMAGTSFGLDIVGEGEEREALKTLAGELNVAIRFLGIIPNDQLPDIYNRYSAFVLPSEYENNPKSLLEAMACGLFVIGNDADGIRELITHEETGHLYPITKGNVRSALDLLSQSPASATEMGLRAREYVVENGSLGACWMREFRIMNRLVENR